MIDLTKPVQTRCGKKVRILCTDRVGSYPVCGLINVRSTREALHTWRSDGSWHLFIGERSDYDLINVPEKHVRWGVLTDAWGFASKEEAETHRDAFHPHRSKCTIVRVEWEDGEGLEAIRYDENCDPWKVADEALKGGE